MIDPPEPLGPRRQDEQRRLVELGRDLRGKQLRVVLDLCREVPEEVVDDVPVGCPCRRSRARASGTDVTRRVARPRRARRRSCTPRASRRRRATGRVGERLDRLGDERREVAVGRERCRRGLAANLLDQSGRERREPARRVGAAQDVAADAIASAARGSAGAGRAVAARERSPVTVHLDDQRRSWRRASRRPIRAAAPTNGSAATITSGSNSSIWRLIRNGSLT